MDTTITDIADWCRTYVADLLEVPSESIDTATDFDRLGIDSAVAVALLIEVEERYGVDLAPEDLFDDPTIDAVAATVHSRLRRTVA